MVSRWMSALIVATGASAQPAAFTDVTTEAGISMNYACEEGLFLLYQMGAGGVVADVNRDGWQDLFVVAGGNGPDRLYINNQDGTFTNEAAAWGVDLEHGSSGACAGDFDNDGWIDLYVPSWGPVSVEEPGHHKLYRNTGKGFVDVAVEAGVNMTSPDEPDGFGSCFGDWDLDGDLDLVVCGWNDTFDGTRLFENNGDGTFTDVTETATDLGRSGVFGFCPRLIDMDGDRYPELLLVADFETSRYYRNDRDGTFTNVTGSAQVSKESNGMGQTVGDVDNDGLLDWYVTSIHGGGLGGNYLYMNEGDHVYDSNGLAGVTDGGWGWGTTAVDVNHDGWLDLVETNGWPTGYPVEQAYLFMNDGDGATFTETALASGLVHMGMGRGIAAFDYDNDGDQDVIIFTYCGAMRLFRNDIDSPSLRLFLDTSLEDSLASEGRHSVIHATVDGLTQMRAIDGGSNYLAHGEISAHVGLAGARSVDELTITWPNGRMATLLDVPASTLTVQYCPADFNGDFQMNVLDFVALQLAFGAGRVDADVNGDGTLNVLDFVAFQLDFAAGCPGL